MLYHERMGTELTHQVWNLNDEDIETDFPTITGQLPSVNVNPTQELRESMNSIIRWILLFLCSSFCVISDNAREILLEFLGAVFDSLATVIAASFPKSLHLLKKTIWNRSGWIHEVSCVSKVWHFVQLWWLLSHCTLHHRKRVFVEFLNHRQHVRRPECGEPLLREVALKSGQIRLYPFKVYCYQSVIGTLKRFLQRPGFTMKCKLWRERGIPDGFLADVFDGRVWKEWQYVDGEAFLAVPRNYEFMLDVDWFQPFKHS